MALSRVAFKGVVRERGPGVVVPSESSNDVNKKLNSIGVARALLGLWACLTL